MIVRSSFSVFNNGAAFSIYRKHRPARERTKETLLYNKMQRMSHAARGRRASLLNVPVADSLSSF